MGEVPGWLANGSRKRNSPNALQRIIPWHRSTREKLNKKPRPVAICTRCGAIYSLSGVNERCGRTVTGNKRCGGGISSALNDNDWEECPSCAATGDKGGAICASCAGTGWLFVRDKWPKKRDNP